MHLDHVVLWVHDQVRALAFYTDVLGLEPVRGDAFSGGHVGFPSVRVGPATILDLMDASTVERVRTLTGGPDDAGGSPINHVCLALDASTYARTLERLAAHGVEFRRARAGAFGARGDAVESGYLLDPFGNVIELRHYGDVPSFGD